jgi:tetratricopeptide (TPR) repeat protein
MIWIYVFMAAGLLLGQTQTTLEEKAKAARESNRLDEAVVLYKRAVERRPDWAEGWWYLGTLQYDQDAYVEAAGALEHAARLNPKSAVAFAMLGLSEAKLGRDRDALEHIETGLKLGAASQADLGQVLQYTKGTLLLAAGKFGDAQETLDALARKGETQEELIVALGCAVLGIRTADQSTRGTVRHAGWAEHYAARGEFTEAAREYAAVAAEAPKFRDVQFACGRFLLANHQDEKAVEAFQREIENTPNHLLARLGIAGIKLKTDPAAGLPYAEQAVKLAPALAEPHYLFGALLLYTGDTERAIRELEAARRLAPHEAKVYFELSLAYAKVQRKDDAARARAEFTRLDKENPK